MKPIYYHPYLVYHKNHDENNHIMVLYESRACYTKHRARIELFNFAKKFIQSNSNSKYKIRVKMVGWFPYIIKRVGLIREVVIGYTNIGYVYPIGDNEYSYLGFIIKRVEDAFRVYDSRCEKLIETFPIYIYEMSALDEALTMIDNIFHSYDHIKSILK